MSAPKGSSRGRRAAPEPRRSPTVARRGASPTAAGARPETEGAKKKKRSPLRQVMAKKVKAPRKVPVGPKQIRHLRGLGHALKPVVHVGKAGVTDELVAATTAQLSAHELIKVKVSEEERDARLALAERLAAATGAVLAQVLGRTLLLYKRNPKNPRIELPHGGAPAAIPAAEQAAEDAADDDDEGADDEGADDEEADEPADDDDDDDDGDGDDDDSDSDDSDSSSDDAL